jgi:hypothetical protein
MSARTRQQTVTFSKAFSLAGFERAQPPGTYLVEIEEELVPDLTFSAYQRTATVMYLLNSPSSPMGGYEVATVDPLDLEAALHRDAEM